MSREFKPRANGLACLGLLSYSATTGVTLHLLACLACVQLLAACKSWATRKIQSWVPASLHNLEHFFTLSHTLPLHDSHLNTGLLIAKIKANLAWNKANKMVDKFQLYKIQYICLVFLTGKNTNSKLFLFKLYHWPFHPMLSTILFFCENCAWSVPKFLVSPDSKTYSQDLAMNIYLVIRGIWFVVMYLWCDSHDMTLRFLVFFFFFFFFFFNITII